MLAHRYLVLSVLGYGAMGVVHRAYDQSVGREVAVKVLQTANAEAQGRLVEEARAMAKLADPHVVAVYDVVPLHDSSDGGEPDGRVLLVMQYVRGQTLRSWLAEERSWQDVLALFRAAGQGLLAAHRAGIVHRDFKPANVLVADDGRVLVTDFGIAGSWNDAGTTDNVPDHRSTALGCAMGTPWYMPPEQHLGLPVDPRADQYAFCVGLWEALTGVPLFLDASDAEALLARKLAALPEWPSASEVPTRIVNAIARGLAPSADERFPTMAALLAQLEPQTRSSMWPAAVGLASLSTLVAALGFSWYEERSQRCTGAAQHMDGVWDEAHRGSIRSAFVATQLPYAADAAERVARRLDGYASAWAHEHRSACEATTLRREQPSSVMDLRMACLHRAKIDLRAITELLGRADREVVEKAQQIVGNLSPLEHCIDVSALQDEVMPPAPADVQAVDSIRAALAEARALIAAGKYHDAQRAVMGLGSRDIVSRYGPLQTEVALVVGTVHDHLRAHDTSEAAFKRALRSGLRWKQWAEAASAASQLVFVVGAMQVRAEEGLSYAAVAEALQPPGDRRSEISLLHFVGSVYERQRRNAEAEAAFRAALDLAEETAAADALWHAQIRNNLANVLDSQGRYVEAEREHRRALSARESELGATHPRVANSKMNLANSLGLQGRYADARREYAEACALIRASLGPDHPLLAACRLNIAHVASIQGDYESAHVEARAALELLQERHGANHADVARARSLLASLLLQLGRHREAEAELRAGLRIRQQTLGLEHPDVGLSLASLGLFLHVVERFEEAETTHRAALTLRRKVLDPEDPDIAESRHHLGSALAELGRLEEAKAELELALAHREKLFGPTHIDVAETRRSLAHVLAKQERRADAEALYVEALAVQQRVLGDEHPVTKSTRDSLARLTSKPRRPQKNASR